MVVRPPAHVQPPRTLPPRSLLISCKTMCSCCLFGLLPLHTYPHTRALRVAINGARSCFFHHSAALSFSAAAHTAFAAGGAAGDKPTYWSIGLAATRPMTSTPTSRRGCAGRRTIAVGQAQSGAAFQDYSFGSFRGARKRAAALGHAQCRHGDARGLEVSPSSLLQNELIQRQIGNRLAQPAVSSSRSFRRFTCSVFRPPNPWRHR
jgi:hypothetical protein